MDLQRRWKNEEGEAEEGTNIYAFCVPLLFSSFRALLFSPSLLKASFSPFFSSPFGVCRSFHFLVVTIHTFISLFFWFQERKACIRKKEKALSVYYACIPTKRSLMWVSITIITRTLVVAGSSSLLYFYITCTHECSKKYTPLRTESCMPYNHVAQTSSFLFFLLYSKNVSALSMHTPLVWYSCGSWAVLLFLYEWFTAMLEYSKL